MSYVKVVLVLVALVICAPVIQAQTVTLDWFAPMSPGPELDLWTELVAQYEEEHPNVDVNLSASPWGDFWQQIAVLFAGNEQPDLVWMHFARFKDYAERDTLLPLDEFIQRDPDFDIEAFAPALVNMFKHRGTQYVLPKDNGGVGVYYNMDKFDDAGVPYPFSEWDWDDFLEMAKKLTRDLNGDGELDQWGVNEFAAPGEFAADYHTDDLWVPIRSFGGDTYTDDYSESLINHPKTIEALQFFADLRNEWNVVARQEQIAGLGDPFRVGKTAMSAFPHASQGYYVRYENRPIDRYGVEFVPSNTGERVMAYGSTGFAIPAGSDHPDAAWNFIRWALSKETVLQVQEHWRWGSPRLDTMGRRFYSQVEQRVELEKNWERVWVNAISDPDVKVGWAKVPAETSRINTIIDTAFDPVWFGQRTAEEAANQAKPRIDRILRRVYGQ